MEKSPARRQGLDPQVPQPPLTRRLLEAAAKTAVVTATRHQVDRVLEAHPDALERIWDAILTLLSNIG